MLFPRKKWHEDLPENQGVDARVLNRSLEHLQGKCGTSGIGEVVIVRNGLVIWKGRDVERTHRIFSCTKMIVGTLYGLLLDEGKCTLDDLAEDYEPRLRDSYPEYRQIRLRHFLTHTAGYNAEGGKYHTDGLDGSETPWKPGEPHFTPGEKFGYWDDAVNLSGIVWTKITRADPLEYLRTRIAEPIGIDAHKLDWQVEETLDDRPRYGYAGGVEISAIELARVGHLFLNKGEWDGKRLISEAWVREATTNQVPATIPLSHYSAADCRGMHGLHWWLNGLRPGGSRALPDAPPATFFTVGTGHNMIFVIPEWNAVIVRLALDFPPPTVEERLVVWNEFLGELSTGVRT
jgi:CubicO group peptidase (beta-lactamase class C family)